MSEYIDSKYIIIGLILVGAEILSLLFNIFLKKFEIKYMILYSSILSFVGLLFISIFWLKSLFPILFVSIFWMVSNALYILLQITINKKCELDEYYFSSLVFNYSIILGLAFLTKYAVLYIYDLIKSRIVDIDDENQKLKTLYFKLFIIIFIQYAITLILTIILFIYEINEKLINWNVSIYVKYFPILGFIFLSSIIIYINIFLIRNKSINFLLIFLVFSPFYIIYYSLLLSEFIDSKYIIIGLLLIGAEILSLLFNIFLKKFETKYFLLFSSILSLIGLLFISLFWIKSWFPILYVSIFWLVSNVIFLLLNFIITKFSYLNKNQTLYSILYFNYGIFVFPIHILIFLLRYLLIKEQYTQDRALGIFLIQNIIIIIFVWIGFSFEWNKIIKLGYYNGWIIAVNSLFLVVPSIHNICIFKQITVDKAGYSVYLILYIPMMIIFYYLFSAIIDEKYILCFLFIIFIELFLSFFFMFFAELPNYWIVPVVSIISGTLSSLLFHFFWLKNTTAFIWIIVFSILIGVYLTVLLIIIREEYNYQIFIFVLALNYSFFSCGVCVAGGILYCIFEWCKEMKKQC